MAQFAPPSECECGGSRYALGDDAILCDSCGVVVDTRTPGEETFFRIPAGVTIVGEEPGGEVLESFNDHITAEEILAELTND